MNEIRIEHRGRVAQTFIYLGKLLRMFLYQSDWKVLPVSAVIAGVVTFVVGANLFVTQEGTLMGTFALACVCIWNGSFNSVQAVCRERSIVKREHRAGLHMSSYVAAHMIHHPAGRPNHQIGAPQPLNLPRHRRAAGGVSGAARPLPEPWSRFEILPFSGPFSRALLLAVIDCAN